MAELIEEFISLNQASKGVEVIPEMLDYGYIDECKDVDELKSIMSSLVSGQHG